MLQADSCISAKMASGTIYFGRFIDTPSATELRIRTGAVLVNTRDGTGIIQKADWTVNGPNDAASKMGVEAPIITAGADGFFFPGFIGESCSDYSGPSRMGVRC